MPEDELAKSLELVGRAFDVSSIVNQRINELSLVDYYNQSDVGYRRFHSSKGALHLGLANGHEFYEDCHYAQAEIVQRQIDLLKPKDVLELGCGNGFNTLYLAQRNPVTVFTGIDLTPNHIAAAGEEARGLGNLHYEIGNYQSLRFSASSFDLVFAVESLCQATDADQALTEIRRMLRLGGRLTVVDCFRKRPLDGLDERLRTAALLVEKTTAVDSFAVFPEWLKLAQDQGFQTLETEDLSTKVNADLTRLEKLARRFLSSPARRVVQWMYPGRLVQNSIAGLLMPLTVGAGVHGYYSAVLERTG